MSLDDEIGDALRAQVASTDPTPGAWERVQAATAVPVRSTRHRWLVAAAVVVLGAIGLAIALANERSQDVSSIDSPTTTIPTLTTSTTVVSTTTTATAVPNEGRPSEIVGVDGTGHLIVIDATSGETVRELAYVGDPSAPYDPNLPGYAAYFIGYAELSSDGQWVYYQTCCEPAVGTVHRVPFGGGDSELVAYGSDPSLSADGRFLAVARGGNGVDVFRTDDPRGFAQIRPVARYESGTSGFSRPTWSPDGSTVYVGRFVGDMTLEIVVLDFDGSSLTERRVLSPPAGEGWAAPVVRADGMLIVDARKISESPYDLLPTTATVIDPRSGQVIATFDVGGDIGSWHYDRSGTWLIGTLEDRLRWFGGGASGDIPVTTRWISVDW